MSKETIIAAFSDNKHARQALADLRDHEFSDRHVGVLARGDDGDAEFKSFKEMESKKPGKGAAVGATAGAGTGVVWSLGIAAGLLPAIGPVIGGGLLGALVASGATGAAAGGLVGALVGLGISDEDAAYYEGELERGKSVIVVKAKNEEQAVHAQKILREHGGYQRPMAA